MTTNTLADARFGIGTGGVTVPRLMRSEWTKLRSLRSTRWTLGVAVLMMFGFGILLTAEAASHWKLADVRSGEADPVIQSLGGLLLAQVPLAVLGALTFTGEYATGMIRATFSMAPRRLPVLYAKVAVLGGTIFGLLLTSSLVTFLIGQAIMANKGIGVSITSPGAARAVFGSAAYLTMIAVFGLAIGAMLRHSAGAITAVLGSVIALPILFDLLPASFQSVDKFLPTLLGEAMASTSPTHVSGLLAAGAGFAVMAAYTIIAVIGAALVLNRRDV
jgi:ABC-2 type transport system permease protein